jgi:hypothetical protein
MMDRRAVFMAGWAINREGSMNASRDTGKAIEKSEKVTSMEMKISLFPTIMESERAPDRTLEKGHNPISERKRVSWKM